MHSVALALSLVFIFTLPWEGMVVFRGLGSANTLIGLGMTAFWLAKVVVTDRLRKPSPFHIVFVAFVLWNVASVFWSADPRTTAGHLMTWVQLLILIYVLWDLYTTRTSILAGLQAVVLGTYVAIGSTIYNYFTGHPYYSHYERYSPAAVTNPDGFGVAVALTLPVAWYLATSFRTRRGGDLIKFVNYAYVPLAFVGIALSGTRTALIASLVGAAYGLFTLTYLRPVARVAISLLLVSVILLLLPRVQTLRSFERFDTTYTELTEGDLNNRTNNWREGMAAFVEHPLLGVGNNMYRSINSLGKVAHNTFLSVLVELGLVGFALFAMILTLAVLEAWRLPKRDAVFWLAALLVWALGVSTLTWADRKETWLFLTLLIASGALTRHNYEPVPPVEDDTTVGQFARLGRINEAR